MAQLRAAPKAMAIIFAIALFSTAALVSAQDFDASPAPAPAIDKGIANSVGITGSVICASLFVSLLALIKH